ncbi:MAG: HAD-IA family hydrolase [Pseudomonadota bacterium]
MSSNDAQGCGFGEYSLNPTMSLSARPALEILIFDWDGTLMDSTGAIVTCMQLAFAERGFDSPPPSAIRRTIGLSLEHAIATLAPELTRAGCASIANAYRRLYALDRGGNAVPFGGVLEVLEALQDEYLLAIATGKSRRGLDRALGSVDLTKYFLASRCADESAPKPAPDMILELVSEFGLEPHHALVIGDTTFDLEMARNAGAHYGCVSYGAHSATELAENNPWFTISDITDLPQEITKLQTLLENTGA